MKQLNLFSIKKEGLKPNSEDKLHEAGSLDIFIRFIELKSALEDRLTIEVNKIQKYRDPTGEFIRYGFNYRFFDERLVYTHPMINKIEDHYITFNDKESELNVYNDNLEEDINRYVRERLNLTNNVGLDIK